MASVASPKTKDYTMFSVIFFITLIGLGVRLAAPLQAIFPLNDGGLFYKMIVDLQQARFALPLYTTYNAAQIPFAYPPLAFYITGLLSELLHISTLDLVRVLPALISTLAIPAFYLLARQLTTSKIQIAFSVFAFAMLPRVFAWHIMGGGITRAFGLLFAILTMTCAYRFYNGHTSRQLWACILLGALTAATHPEAAVHTAITALVFYLWKDRSLKGFLYSLGMAVGIIILTAPWWVLVISRHGFDPFLAAVAASGQDSNNPLIGLILFFRFLFTEESFLPLLSMLGLLGFFASLARKNTLLPAWLFFIHFIEPRGGTLFMMIPLALLIGYALERVILPALQSGEENFSGQNLNRTLEQLLGGKVKRYFILFLFIYSLLSAFNTTQNIQFDLSLKSADLQAFEWVRENTSKNSQFILITGQHHLRDAWSEWFPVLAERRSQATIFGYEWVNDGQFGARVQAYQTLQACAYQDNNCLDSWSQDTGAQFSHVYIWNRKDPMQYPLSIYLKQHTDYALAFQNNETLIFQFK